MEPQKQTSQQHTINPAATNELTANNIKAILKAHEKAEVLQQQIMMEGLKITNDDEVMKVKVKVEIDFGDEVEIGMECGEMSLEIVIEELEAGAVEICYA